MTNDDDEIYDGPRWTCSFCTFCNPHSLYLTCAACGEERERLQRRGSAFHQEELDNLSASFREDIEKQEEIEVREKMKRRASEFSRDELESLSDSFQQDILKQEEIFERRGSMTSAKQYRNMSNPNPQEKKQISTLGSAERPFSIDEIAFFDESSGRDDPKNSLSSRMLFLPDSLSYSLRRDLGLQTAETETAFDKDASFLLDSSRERNLLREQLLVEEEDYNQERENQQQMAAMLLARRLEIEQSEGITLLEFGERATRPGVSKISPEAMDWRAQQHMVMQWDEKLTARKEELLAMRASLNMF